MARTPQQLKTAFYNVLKTDSAGTSVRTALGAGASSVIHRTELSTLPARPFVALSWGDTAGGGARNRAVRNFYPVWFLYDDALYKWSRLEALIPLIEAAYPEDAIAMCYLDFLPVRELTDRAVSQMPAKSMPFHIVTRG